MRSAVLALAIVAAVLGGSALAPRRATQQFDADELVAQWQSAVQRHAPGQNDAAVAWLGSLSATSWQSLNTGLKHAFSTGGARTPSLNPTLERGAVLHMDAAMFGAPAPARVVGDLPPGAPNSLVRTLDGESGGSVDANWNWVLARQLLDLVAPSPRGDPFVATWYHAAAAYMMQQREYGEAGSHLQHAAAIFPNDARLLFDRACLSEALGMPRSQLVMDDLRAKTSLPRASGPIFIPGQPPPLVSRSGLPTASEANREAERLFRQTLESDRTLVEARVRLGRLLEQRGRFSDADSALRAALLSREIVPDRMLTYYAQLFAARASRALGQDGPAIVHLRAAMSLFPDAQSALVARSQIAMIQGDDANVQIPLRRLDAGDPTNRPDPWWLYDQGPGRNAERALADLRLAAARLKR